MKSKIKFLLATIMMLVGVTATHAEDITSNITIIVDNYCHTDGDAVSSLGKAEYTVKEGVVVTFQCNKYWDATVTIYLNGTAVATWPGYDYESEYVWTAKKDAKIKWTGYNQYSANIYLTETATVDVTGITLDKTEASMIVGGETLTLIPTVLPGDATDKSVTWSSSNEAVATVTDGVVTAKAAGEATITATATNGTADTSDDFSATCEVTVTPATYTVTLKEGTDDAANWTITPAEATTAGVAAGTEVKASYGGVKKVKSVKAKKKSSAPTLKDALADGATVVITYTWYGESVTTFTYTNNGGNYTGNTTGDDAEYFDNNMSMDGTTLVFAAINPDHTDAFVVIRFYTDTNEYYFANKGSGFTSFTISVNGTDVTSQLKEVK